MLPRRRARQRRRRLIFGGVLAAFAGFTLFGFFGLPPIIKAQGEKRLGAALHRPVSIGAVRVNPFALSLTLEKFSIRERDGKSLFVGWERLYVNFEFLSLFTKEWRFAAIELSGPSTQVVVNPDGSLNFSDLLTELGAAPAKAGEKPAAASKPVHIVHLLLTGARMEFRDLSRAQPFATTLGPVGLRVADFRTMGGKQAPYSFEAVTEAGEKFSWKGWMNAAPFRSGGELGLSNVVLKKYAPYYAEKLGVDLVDGLLTVRGRYEVNFGDKTRVMQLIDGSFALRNVKVQERGSGEMLLELPAADITGAAADALTLKASVNQVTLQGGRLKLRREADGTLNLAKLAGAPAPAAANPGTAATATTGTASPLDFTAGELALRDWAIDVQDLAAPIPVQLGVSALNVSLKNFSLAAGTQMPVELDLNWQPQGKLHVAGQIALQPVQAELAIKAEGLGLMPLAPYLAQKMEARLTDGTFSTDGKATLALAEGQPPALTYEGNAWVERIDLVTGSPGESFAGFSDLILNGIKVATAPQLAISLTEINLNSPFARVIREKDGLLNLVRALTSANAPSPAEAQTPVVTPVTPPDAAATSARPNIEVGRVVINSGEFSFTDRSISPQVRMAVNQFGGTLAGWSSTNPGRGDVDLKATVDTVGPVAITGKFDPLGAAIFVDAKLAVQRVDLLPVSPYVGKFAGYELSRGKLFVDVQAKIADRKVDMVNLITLDQFTFGRPTNSPDATKLPVRLGVALLKDLDGKIVLDVPVQGSLDDPEFRIGRAVWRVVGNLLTKVAVSPFSLVGAMFGGGGGEDLNYQEFAPGTVILTPESLIKLGVMLKALQARPGLNLGIEGNFDEAADRYALRQAKYQADLRQAAWDDQQPKEPKLPPAPSPSAPMTPPKPRPMSASSSVGPKPLVSAAPKSPPPADFVVKPEQRAALVKKLFDHKFPPGTKFGTPLPPPPLVQPPPPRPSGSIVRRVIDFVTLREQRDKEAFAKVQKETQAEYMKEVQAAAAAGLPVEEMEGRLAEVVEVSADDLRALADARASVIRDYLINEGKIAPERLFLTQPVAAVAPEPKEGAEPVEGAVPAASKGPRVFLELQ